MTWGNKIEIERKRRINVAVWAYAYEVESDSIVSDAKFDEECMLVDESIKTGDRVMDRFFKEEFDPFTGQWIHKHPKLDGIKAIYEKYFDL